MSVPCFLRSCDRFRRAWLLALFLLAAPAWPAPVAVSFDDTLRLAVERAPALAARQAQIEAAREDAARAGRLPDPRLTLALANWPVTGGDAFEFGADDMTMKQVGVMQSFPARAKRKARQEVAQRAIEQVEAQSAADRMTVRQSAAQAWIDLWAAQDEATIMQTLREPAQVAIDTSRARLATGTGTATDALAAQAAALDLENRIDAAQADVEAARAGLARWLDVAPSDIQIDGDPPDLDRLPVDEATLLASTDELASLLPWRAREALAAADVTKAAAERHPDWSLGLTYGQRDHSPTGGRRSDMLMLEFGIDLPLFAGNRQDRDVAARRAERVAAAADHADARRAETEALQRALAEWHGLRRQIVRKEEQILPLAHDRSRTALAAYAGGAELQPWLESRRDEIELHIEHAQHLSMLGRAWAALAYLMPDRENAP